MPLKFDEISKVYLKLLTSVKKTFCHIFVAFLEYMNFTALHYAVILVQQSVLYALFALLCFLFATLKDFAVLLHQKRDQMSSS